MRTQQKGMKSTVNITLETKLENKNSKHKIYSHI
jgi:hypothetical protein